MDASWAPLAWECRPWSRTALQWKPSVRGSQKVSKCLFSRRPNPSMPPQSAKCSTLISQSNMDTILFQPHLLETERWFTCNCWSRWGGNVYFQGALETKEIPSQQHPPTCMPHLRLWTGQSMPCILSNPKAWKSLFVNMHVDNTSKWSHNKINREHKQPFFLWQMYGYLYTDSK